MSTILGPTARLVGRLMRVPVRFVGWVYRRRPHEPEGSMRRVVDSQAGTRSAVYQVGMQEVYGAENQLRDADDALEAENQRPR